MEPISNSNLVRLHVSEIDRDTREREIYEFEIEAYKVFEETTFATRSACVIIIDDINDNYPEITLKPDENNVIKIREEEFLTLPFDSIIVHDRDLVRTK